jgi:DNA-binding NarL/FixJ family response regulator
MTSKPAHPRPIRIGILAAEPIRVAGLASIFDLSEQPGQAQLIPVIGVLEDLIGSPEIEYIVVDLNDAQGGLGILETVRDSRPRIKLIVIGPEGDDELVMNAIVAGARAYLGRSSGPKTVRDAIDAVTSGSIWAPRTLLSRLIDRLLHVPQAVPVTSEPRMTPREEQVLKLIMRAQSTREIARQLGIEQRSVKAHITRLMKKAGVDNRVRLSTSALSLLTLTPQSSRTMRPGTSRKIVTKQST